MLGVQHVVEIVEEGAQRSLKVLHDVQPRVVDVTGVGEERQFRFVGGVDRRGMNALRQPWTGLDVVVDMPDDGLEGHISSARRGAEPTPRHLPQDLGDRRAEPAVEGILVRTGANDCPGVGVPTAPLSQPRQPGHPPGPTKVEQEQRRSATLLRRRQPLAHIRAHTSAAATGHQIQPIRIVT
jgi:hypothetical protein